MRRHPAESIGSGIYRSRSGVFLGVMGGIADRFDLSAFWLRFIALAALVATGFFPTAFLYVLLGLVMKKESCSIE